MISNFYSSLKRLLLSIFLVVSCCINTTAQVDNTSLSYRTPKEITHLNHLYNCGEIKDTTYLNDFKTLTEQFLYQGKKFTIKELEYHLKLYRELAWKQKSSNIYKQKYYLILLNNAYLNEQRAASIYYAEKLSILAHRENTKRSLIQLTVKTDLFAWQKRTDKIISTLQTNQNFLVTEYTEIINNPTKNPIQALDALNLLGNIYNAYALINDTINTDKIYRAAHQLYCNIIPDIKVNQNLKVDIEYAMYTLDYHQAIFYKKHEKAIQALDKLNTLLNDQSFPNHNQLISYEILKQTLLSWQSNLYLQLGDVNKAAYYISKYDSLPTLSNFKKTKTYTYKANLASLRQNYQQAYNYSLLANTTYEEIAVDLIKEMDVFLQSELTSEATLQAYLKSEKQKDQRTIFFCLILLVVLILAILIYRKMTKRHNYSQKKIAEMTATSTIQIAVLNRLTEKARQEEKEKISQNLHDNLAGLLAAIHNRIELACEDNSDLEKTWLRDLHTLTQQAYQEVRIKSHQLYHQAHSPVQGIFTNHIENLVKIAFPTPYYQVHLNIDRNAVQYTSTEIQTELIRIIQELFTNIIKHARANKIELLLYKEESFLHLFVEDNGIGFQKKTIKNNSKSSDSSSIGLHSLSKRLALLNGTIQIKTSNGKTESHICIPLLKNKVS